MKEKIKKIHSLRLCFILISILVNFIFLFSWFSKKATPRFTRIAELKINEYIAQTTSDFKVLVENNSSSLYKIEKKSNGEIVSIDYDMEKVYEMADKLTSSLETNLFSFDNLNQQQMEHKDRKIILYLPIGIVSDSVFLSQLGPKIPIMIQFIGSIFSNVKTRVKDYGINNALLEVYLEIKITYEIFTPITKNEKTFSYELLLDSKVIQGTVPNLYGGYLESKSAFFDISFP